VVAVDLRGHGQSDRPQLEYTLELFAGDIAAICGDLKLEHLILVGHSMGGTIALEVATRYPDLLSGIVLIDTVLQPDAKLRDALKAMYENLLMDFSETPARAGEESLRLFALSLSAQRVMFEPPLVLPPLRSRDLFSPPTHAEPVNQCPGFSAAPGAFSRARQEE
jgi:pimeloyl-ACP methyl ester carboxylesterase